MSQKQKAPMGDLKIVPPESLLVNIFFKKMSGYLDLTRKKGKRRFFFLKGIPIYLESNIPEDSLINLLKKENIINAMVAGKVLKEKKRSKINIFNALLIHGGMEKKQLEKWCQLTLERGLASTINWPDGSFQFYVLPTDMEWEVPFIEIDFLSLLMEASFKYQRISRAMTHYGKYFSYPVLMGPFYSQFEKYFSKAFSNMPSFLEYFGENSALFEIIDKFAKEYELSIDEDTLNRGVFTLLNFQMIRPDLEATPKVREEIQQPEDSRLEKVDLREILLEFEGKRSTPLKIFGLHQFDMDELEVSYINLLKSYHPDKFIEQEDKDFAQQITFLLGETHDLILANPGSVTGAGIQVSRNTNPKINREKVDKAILYEKICSEGRGMLKMGNFQGAHDCFMSCFENDHQSSEVLANLGWTIFLLSKDENSFKKARKMVEQGLHKNDKMDDANYYLGAIYKSEKDLTMAKAQFEKALELNPKHREAKRELENLKKRKEKDDNKGFFGRFFNNDS